MNCAYRRVHAPPQSRQRGFALYVALIILVMLTLVGVAMLGNNGLQTKMAYGSSEITRSFQTAESGLAAGENWLVTQASKPIADCAAPCATSASIWDRYGIATPTVPTASSAYTDEAWWLANGRQYNYPATASGAGALGTSTDPRYLIEYAGADNTGSLKLTSDPTYKLYYYLVTARGYGAGGDSRTLVQSVYAKGY